MGHLQPTAVDATLNEEYTYIITLTIVLALHFHYNCHVSSVVK